MALATAFSKNSGGGGDDEEGEDDEEEEGRGDVDFHSIERSGIKRFWNKEDEEVDEDGFC